MSVASETPLLQTDRAEMSETLSANELASLPVLGRNVTELLLAMPGALQDISYQTSTDENPQGGLQVEVNGQSFTANGFLLDGTTNQNPLLAIDIVNPNIDSIQEFKVTTSNYDAEFGSVAAALVQATTKSGTNQVHGTAFEYLRNNVLNSANPFTSLNPPVRWNQFGGSLGGPIKKNKLFIFGDYQGTRQRNGGSLVATVPTVAERSGNLQGLLGNYICSDGSVSASPCGSPLMVPTTEGGMVPAQGGMVFDPTTGNPDGTGREAITTNGEVNVIPVAQPIANLMSYLPPPNTGTPGQIYNNFIGSGVELYDIDQPDVRMDYNISSKASFFARYSLADFTIDAPAVYGVEAGGPTPFNFAGQSLDRTQSLALGFTYTVSPTLVGDFRFGTFRYRIRVEPFGVGTYPATEAGLPGLNLGTQETSGMPAFYINGAGGFDFGYALGVNACNCPLKETENQFDWITNWTKEHGNHTIKWGAEVPRDEQQRIPSDEHRSGEITFTDAVTGNATVDALDNSVAPTGAALASFLLAQPSAFDRIASGIYYPGLRETRIFLYAQDTWRVTRKLTLDYGVRWENYLPQAAAKPGGTGMFDPLTGMEWAAGIGGIPLDLGVHPYNLGFLPRLGIAYQVQANTVVRAGYGWGFSPAGYGSIFGQGAEYNPPALTVQTIPQVYTYAPDFNLLTGPPAPPYPPVGSNGQYPLPDGVSPYNWFWPLSAYRVPMAYFWNATVQHQFSNGLALQVAYVGNVGRHLYVNPNINQAVPGPGSLDSRRPFYAPFGLEQGIYYTCNCDNSNYNGLQVKLEKRASHGLDFVLNYTYSKAMGSSNFGGGGFDNNDDWGASYGPAYFNSTQTLTFINVWQIPFGHGRHWGSDSNKAVDLILGGWSLDGITTLDSGRPFSPMVSYAPLLNDTDFNAVRADIIGNPHVANQSAAEWFNPAAFSEPQQPYRDGTASADSLWGPAMYVFNLALAKTFVIKEGKTLEFRWENFNAFNIDNYGLPANVIDVPGAGVITSTQTPMRQMQFGLHFRF
jgi:outer membrane receptor protein involved in Fe transport